MTGPRRAAILGPALVAIVVAGLAVRLWGPARTARLLACRPRRADAAVHPETVGWAVRTADRVVPRTACLERALAARALCRRYGYAASVDVGCVREGEHLRAHSWAVCGEYTVVGGDVTAFDRLGRIADP
ncbi:lasso peptide biosynthesis B2 protein [Halococcoides cellulosivorans]|uniref:lasso peptide biosynthesis B2 protein n=1 Tax=Halococcoides cellulosivorans TaxID=1679096 RepID=UPI00131EEDCB|nr:lasso peptide biosynthesis B2 protein [Halococcoides cellulosivorans]